MRDIEEILDGYFNNKDLKKEELSYLQEWVKEPLNKEYMEERFRIFHYSRTVFNLGKVDKNKIERNVFKNTIHKSVFSSYLKYAAAVIVFVFSVSLLYYISVSPQEEILYTQQQEKDSIFPGNKEAWLLMSNGEKIRLKDYKEEIIEEEKGVKVKVTGSKLDYSSLREGILEKDSLKKLNHTLYIPRGGEYDIELEDGTRVWLNSDTELTYPLMFGENERKVVVKGEAFFDVQKDSKRPFIIESEKATIRVLGTKFNFSSYEKEDCNITLVEGKIEVSAMENKESVILYPNQNLNITVNGTLSVQKNVDVEDYVGWQRGFFSFNESSLKDIFRKLERWYNIEVEYSEEYVKEYLFTAWFKREYAFEKVINQLEQTNKIRFEIEGKKIIVKDARKN